MKVKQLIEKLNIVDQESEVMIAFDSGIRMDVEVVAQTERSEEDVPVNSVILTDEGDYKATKKYHEMRKV